MIERPRSAYRPNRLGVLGVVVLGVGALAAASPAAAADAPDAVTAVTSWSQFGDGPGHGQIAAHETAIRRTTVGGLTRSFAVSLPGVVDGPPVYQGGVVTASGTRDLLFMTTTGGTTVAVDSHSGARIWTRTVGPGSCHINNGSSPCYTTAQPALDPNATSVYAYGLDGRVHKYATGTGTETKTGGWPEQTTTKPFDEKGSSDLTVVAAGSNVFLYAANGGYPGDNGDYQGHITTVNLRTGAQRVFNTQCSAQTVHFVETPGTPDCAQRQSAVWARPGVVVDAALQRIFFATGNGTYDPAAGDWGDSIVALHLDGVPRAGQLVDSYTPTNYQQLQQADADLGSTAPVLVPTPPGTSVQHLGVQSGKDGMLRLVDLADLSGHGSPGHTGGELGIVPVPQGGEVLTQPLAWKDPATGTVWVFVADSNGISGLRVTAQGTVPVLTPTWTVHIGGFTPTLAGGVLFYPTAQGAVGLNPLTGASLWADHAGSVGLHWNSIIVVNGRLYYTDSNSHLYAYGLA